MSAAYYNEIEPYTAQWLRNLATAGAIVPGHVDARSILDVDRADLAQYTQCHFFAGIGGWSYALRLAGWPDDEPVWTGSCPCQPLSSAGRGQGHADERHLWPAFYRLIAECRPPTIIGEQVASKLGREWLAGVRADLEDLGYAVGAADLPAACVGAPHIRQRLFWVADATKNGRRSWSGSERFCESGTAFAGDRGGLSRVAESAEPGWREGPRRHGGANGGSPTEPGRLRGTGRLANADRERPKARDPATEWTRRNVPRGSGGAVSRGWLGDADEPGLSLPQQPDLRGTGRRQAGRAAAVYGGAPAGRLGDPDRGGCQVEWQPEHDVEQGAPGSEPNGSGSTGFWDGAVWLACADGKARRIKSEIFPLAPRLPGDVGRLRGAGNSIVPQAAAAFVRAFMETQSETRDAAD